MPTTLIRTTDVSWLEGVTPDELPRGTYTQDRPYTGKVTDIAVLDQEPGALLLHQYTQPHLYDGRDLERSAALGAYWNGTLEVSLFLSALIDEAVDAYIDTTGKYAWPCPTCRHAVFTRDLGDACPVCA